MTSDPRDEVVVEIVPDPIPRALWDSLFTAFADAAIDYGLTIGGRILGEAGSTRRAGGSTEMRALRQRVAELETSAGAVEAQALDLSERLDEAETRAAALAGDVRDERHRADAAEQRAEAVRQAIDWLGDIIATSPCDWGTSRDLALVYGVVLGWDDPADPEDDGGALREITAMFTDSPGRIDRMQVHRAVVRSLTAALAVSPAGSPTPDVATDTTEDSMIRFEWGHQFAPGFEDRLPLGGVTVSPCPYDGDGCCRPRHYGFPAVHVWQTEPDGDWRTGPAPEATP